MLQFHVPQVELLGVSEAEVLRGLQMLDRRPSHGMVYYYECVYSVFKIYLSSPPKSQYELYQASKYIILYIFLLPSPRPVDRVARGRHEAFCKCAKKTGRDAPEGGGELGGQAAGGGVGQADGGGRHEGLQASGDGRSQFCGCHLCGETILYREKPFVDLKYGIFHAILH